ncbi:hypothetical protein, partial [Thermococcus waiotapuensis]
EKVEHSAALIRRGEEIRPVSEVRGNPGVTPEKVGDALKELAFSLYELSGRSFQERGKHMRRWNIFRLLGIPTGYLRHLEKDEEMARQNREALLALSIIEHVLGIRKPSDLENVELKPVGWGIFELEVEDEPKDSVYRELYRVDGGFRRALRELIDGNK